MKKEISIIERPEKFTEQYLEAYSHMSWYDFVKECLYWNKAIQFLVLQNKNTHKQKIFSAMLNLA